MNLNDIRSIQQAPVDIVHPVSHAKTGARFTLASADHPARRKAIAETSRRMRAAGANVDVEFLDEMNLDIVIESVLGWSGVKIDGKELEYSPAACRELLSDPQLAWLVDQLFREVGRLENFIETSAPV
jgi:hypothetical protein